LKKALFAREIKTSSDSNKDDYPKEVIVRQETNVLSCCINLQSCQLFVAPDGQKLKKELFAREIITNSDSNKDDYPKQVIVGVKCSCSIDRVVIAEDHITPAEQGSITAQVNLTII